MERTTILFATVLLFLVSNNITMAQEDTSNLVGERVRVMTREAPTRRLVGRVVGVEDNMILLRTPSVVSKIKIPLQSIVRFDVSRHKRRGPFRNAGIGLVSGAMTGLAVVTVCELGDKSCLLEGLATGGVLGMTGALVGLFYGMSYTETWESRNLCDLRFSTAISPSRKVAVTVDF